MLKPIPIVLARRGQGGCQDTCNSSRTDSPEFGEELLQQGKADFIAIGRALIADPDLSNKVASGKSEYSVCPC